MTDLSAATWGAAPHPRETEPAPRSLRALVEAGVPDYPAAELDHAIEELESGLDVARRERDEQRTVLLRRADSLVRALHARIASVESRRRRLERLRAGFEELGEFGADGLRRAEDRLRELHAYHEKLRSIESAPVLREARDGLREQLEQDRERVTSRLDHESVVDTVERVANELLVAVDPADADWAGRAMDRFERDVREWRRFHHLPTIERFWEGLAERLQESDPVGAETARARATSLADEIARRRELRETNERARREALEIREAVADLADLGPEEASVRMHVWLGRLRRWQDDFDLEEGAKKEIYLTFGAANRARRDLAVPGFIDALDRNFRTDWNEYVREWEMKLDAARAQDRLDSEQDERLEREREERERLGAEERAAAEARLREITSMLREIAATDDWQDDADAREDVREMLLAGVDQDGCQNEEFLAASRPYAALAYGGDFRRLRRSLAKRGVDFAEVRWIEPERAESPDEELFRRLGPRWRGRTLAIVGGLPREQVRRRIEEGLGLKEARWYEYYRDTCEQDQAEAAIRSGAVDLVLLLIRYAGHKINEVRETARSCGVECRVIDRGCGVTSILRGLEAAGRRPETSRG